MMTVRLKARSCAGRRFFDPRHWRVVLVDQRGCGASTPHGRLADNTTQVRPRNTDIWLPQAACPCPDVAVPVDVGLVQMVLSWIDYRILLIHLTQALIQDFEVLREHLGIESWVLFGGSWGTALSLAYAQAHTHRCAAELFPRCK